jgi:hypothetical protein
MALVERTECFPVPVCVQLQQVSVSFGVHRRRSTRGYSRVFPASNVIRLTSGEYLSPRPACHPQASPSGSWPMSATSCGRDEVPRLAAATCRFF